MQCVYLLYTSHHQSFSIHLTFIYYHICEKDYPITPDISDRGCVHFTPPHTHTHTHNTTHTHTHTHTHDFLSEKSSSVNFTHRTAGHGRQTGPRDTHPTNREILTRPLHGYAF